MMEYPKRPTFFLAKVVRLLTKSAAAMEIGGDGVALVAIIAAQEDSCRYTRPVNFWNTQLAPLIGVRGGDPDGLRRVRERCIRAGWLHYEPGNKRLPARYFVTIPAAVSGLQDSGSDESPHEYTGNTAPIQPQSHQESAENLPRICRESAENPPPSSPSPSPNPIPLPHAAGEDPFNGESKTPERQPIKATGRDLFQVLRGCLTYFGKDHGIAALDAALLVHDALTITRCLREAFTKRQVQIPADDIMAVIAQAMAPPVEKIETPETLPPRIDLAHLRATGQMRLNPLRDQPPPPDRQARPPASNAGNTPCATGAA